MRRIRPTILLAVLMIGSTGLYALTLGNTEIPAAAITGIVGLASKIMDSEEAMEQTSLGAPEPRP